MEISLQTGESVDRIRLSGKIDQTNADSIRTAVRERLRLDRKCFILNFIEVEFINSAGLGALVGLLKDIQTAGGRLMLSDLAVQIQEIFDITQLSDIFTILPTEEDAVGRLAPRATPA